MPGLLGQSKTYGKERLEAACLRGYLTGANRLHHIRNMLKHGLEQQPIANTRQDPLQDIHHDNVHGGTTSTNPTDQEKPCNYISMNN